MARISARHLSERIIQALISGPLPRVTLREKVLAGTVYTPQAFYKACAQLRKEEVITLHKNEVSLSIVWIRKELARATTIAETYQIPAYRSSFGGLKDTQKLVYKFKNLAELDLFWTHAVLLVAQDLPQNTPILSLFPHFWFDVLRPVSMDVWFELTGKRNIHINILTHADSKEKRWTPYVPQKNMENLFKVNPLKQSETTYINIVGDMIFDARVDQSSIADLRAAAGGGPVNINELTSRSGVFKLTIERNHAKTAMIRKKCQKYFTIPL